VQFLAGVYIERSCFSLSDAAPYKQYLASQELLAGRQSSICATFCNNTDLCNGSGSDDLLNGSGRDDLSTDSVHDNLSTDSGRDGRSTGSGRLAEIFTIMIFLPACLVFISFLSKQ
jgi:hypothetical protein